MCYPRCHGCVNRGPCRYSDRSTTYPCTGNRQQSRQGPSIKPGTTDRHTSTFATLHATIPAQIYQSALCKCAWKKDNNIDHTWIWSPINTPFTSVPRIVRSVSVSVVGVLLSTHLCTLPYRCLSLCVIIMAKWFNYYPIFTHSTITTRVVILSAELELWPALVILLLCAGEVASQSIPPVDGYSFSRPQGRPKCQEVSK